MFAAIPSPGSGAIHIGPLQVRAYGFMIALGVIAAVWLAGRRWVARGGRPDDISAIALWGVPAGVIGARVYHVATDWKRFRGDWWRVLEVWEGGLGIWGGIALGVLAGLWAARRRGMALTPLLDTVAPALALAQAIGRWGNWWNQELFGRPTDLPWGLEVDIEHRPAGYESQATFHPTFLYESLWNFALCGALLAVDRRWRSRVRPGNLFWCYVAGYTFARFFIERMRIDEASKVAGLRVNEWVSALVFVGAVAIVVVRQVRWSDRGAVVPAVAAAAAPVPEPEPAVPPGPPAPAGPQAPAEGPTGPAHPARTSYAQERGGDVAGERGAP